MARWRLTASHYLNLKVPVEWQQVETDRDTGVQARKTYNVPKLLDLQDGKCYNDRDGIVVSDGNNAQPLDYIFEGTPTPDMEPLDDDAVKVSESFAHLWKHPIDTLPANGGDYGTALISAFEKQISTLIRLGKAEPAEPVSANTVGKEEFDKLQEQVAALMARNAELEGKPAATTERRK